MLSVESESESDGTPPDEELGEEELSPEGLPLFPLLSLFQSESSSSKSLSSSELE